MSLPGASVRAVSSRNVTPVMTGLGGYGEAAACEARGHSSTSAHRAAVGIRRMQSNHEWTRIHTNKDRIFLSGNGSPTGLLPLILVIILVLNLIPHLVLVLVLVLILLHSVPESP